jgi:hypothetical protein
MSEQSKKRLLILYFTFVYLYALFYVPMANNITFIKVIVIIFLLYFLFLVIDIYQIIIKNKIFYFSIILKIVIFTFFLIIYFWIEQGIIKIILYSIGGSGGFIRNEIYHNISYHFKWYEILFWNFIFSLHYPIYIFIFFKPFINHLDKSIRKIKAKENINKENKR